MAGEKHLSASERAHIQHLLREMRAKLPPAAGSKDASWQAVTDELNAGAPPELVVRQESIRKAGERGEAGTKVAKLLAWNTSRRDALATPAGPAATAEAPRAATYVVPDERYHTVAEAFSRARSLGISEHVLNTVRLKLGVAKSTEAPTVHAVEVAIRDELKERRRAEKLYEAIDIDDEATSSPRGEKR